MEPLTDGQKKELIQRGRDALMQIDAYETDFKARPSEYAWKVVCENKAKLQQIKDKLGDDAHLIGENMYPGSHA